MLKEKGPYEILGLNDDATLRECKVAYRNLIKQYHPDSRGDVDTEKFNQIKEAYEKVKGGYTVKRKHRVIFKTLFNLCNE